MTALTTRRLLAAIYPTRTEMAINRLAVACWKVSETGPIASLGDRIERLEILLRKRRVAKGREMAGRKYWARRA